MLLEHARLARCSAGPFDRSAREKSYARLCNRDNRYRSAGTLKIDLRRRVYIAKEGKTETGLDRSRAPCWMTLTFRV